MDPLVAINIMSLHKPLDPSKYKCDLFVACIKCLNVPSPHTLILLRSPLDAMEFTPTQFVFSPYEYKSTSLIDQSQSINITVLDKSSVNSCTGLISPGPRISYCMFLPEHSNDPFNTNPFISNITFPFINRFICISPT